jgi:exonuclease III
MNSFQNNRNWVILSWNVRDINSESKWEAIKSKALEAKCDIMCLQETKGNPLIYNMLRNFVQGT